VLKLNIGAGSDLRKDYVNIDLHSRSEIETRYGIILPDDIEIKKCDIFNLPYTDETVDQVLCLGFLEHLSFEDEGRFFREVQRVLKKGAGVFHFTVPDFDSLARQWIDAEDSFKDFYVTGVDEHWFGNGNRTLKNKWGYLTASIFGNQNGSGQFHKNAYTEKKVRAIMEKLNFYYTISNFDFKDTGVKMIECKALKL